MKYGIFAHLLFVLVIHGLEQRVSHQYIHVFHFIGSTESHFSLHVEHWHVAHQHVARVQQRYPLSLGYVHQKVNDSDGSQQDESTNNLPLVLLPECGRHV